MENRPPLTSPDGSSNWNPPERCPRPLYSRDSPQEDHTVPCNVKEVIKMEDDEFDVMEEFTKGYRDPSKDVKREPVTYLSEELKIIKVEIKEEEEERLVSGDQQSMEEGEMIMESKQEEFSLHMDTNGSSNGNPPERCPRPLYSQNSTQEDHTISCNIKEAIKKEDDEFDVMEEFTKEYRDPFKEVKWESFGGTHLPERCPHPLYSWDSKKNNHTICDHDQGEELKGIKVEGKEEEKETLVSGDEQSMEKDGPLSYSRDSIQEYHSFIHHDQGEEPKDIKVEIKGEEEERLVSGDRQSMEEGEMIMESKQEESSLYMDTNGRPVKNSLERRPISSADWNSKEDGIRPTSPEVNPNAQNIPRPYYSSTSMDVSNLEGSSDQSQTFVQLSSHTTDPSYPGESSLTQEMVHASENPVSCLGCGASLKTRSELFVHLRSHTSVTFSCSECGKSFTEKREFLTHQKTHNSSCSECGKCFSDKSKLRSHLRTHTGERPFSCLECGKCFTQQGSVIRHQRRHKSDLRFSCSECGKFFLENSHLVTHLRTHTGERPFSCSECGKCFIQQGDLIRHQRRHKNDLRFSCSECGKFFLQKTHLVRHQKIHKGERPFLSRLREGFHSESQPSYTPGNSHGGASSHVNRVREEFH